MANDRNRVYGRCGPGAVFGSKKLKAVRVSGPQKIGIRDRELYQSGSRSGPLSHEAGAGHQEAPSGARHGGARRAHQPHQHAPAPELPGLHATGTRTSTGSRARPWPRRCSRGRAAAFSVRSAARGIRRSPAGAGRTRRARAPSTRRRSSWVLSATSTTSKPSPGPITAANELGLDTISFGGTMACAMELFETGLITSEDTGGLDLSFGRTRCPREAAVRMTALREGIGDRLAEGSFRLAASCGRPEYSMTVKKLEIPAYDPRASFTQALGYMTSPSGACHLRGGYAVSLAFFGGTKEIPRYSLLQSPIAIRNMQNLGILQDSLGVCRFTGYAFSTEPWARMASGATGGDFSVARARGDRQPGRRPRTDVQPRGRRDGRRTTTCRRASATSPSSSKARSAASPGTIRRGCAGTTTASAAGTRAAVRAASSRRPEHPKEEDMSAGKWKASEELLKMFQAVGRASLAYDIQDSHSGNMAVRWTDEDGGGAHRHHRDRLPERRPGPDPDLFPLALGDRLRLLQGLLRDRRPRPDPVPARRPGLHACPRQGARHRDARRRVRSRPSLPPFIPVDPLGYLSSRRARARRLVRRPERLSRDGPDDPRAARRDTS